MAGFKLDVFKGLRPRVSATKLQLGEAVTALNLKLGSGDLEPIPDKATVQAVGSGRLSRTIYKMDNAGSPLWLEWDDYVDVVRGPVKDDSIERTYYTGDTTGNGSPKVTTTELVDLGGGGPYPEDWRYIGVPVPGTAPVVTVTPLPEDKLPQDRLASNFKVDELIIGSVRWIVYPGTGTRNQQWKITEGWGGFFNIAVGSSFRVLSKINSNKVTIESATVPGVTFENYILPNYFAWPPSPFVTSIPNLDEQGTTQTAVGTGINVPPGMEVTIPDHNLNVGDVLVLTTASWPNFAFSSTGTIYEQDWPEPTFFPDTIILGDYYAVENVHVAPSAVSGDTPWTIEGSFFYDIDRAQSASSELEDRQYVYTYVNEWGEEGPPSDPSNVVSALDGQEVLISGMELPPTIGYDISEMRLYRTNSTEAGTEYQFVKAFTTSATTLDSVFSVDLGEVIASTSWDPPPAALTDLTTMPNGMLVGFVGKQLYFCEPFYPHAWPAEYDQAVDYDIVGLAAFGNSVVALTKGWPYVITGAHPRNINVRPIKINQACVSKESIATDGDRVYYASPDGLVEIGINGIRLVTESLLDKEDWEAYSPSTLVSEFHEGRYYGFYDFDVSAVDPVITAEVSGTITNANETNIRVDGSKTIILTLTNDEWVAAGVSFDNQRQNIIDGLTCSTSQTLGWNNIVRDSELSVTDVVRTSDTVVTITLPIAAGYAITAPEIVRPTIPHAALVLSNIDLTTSTFTIKHDVAAATITLSGTLGGAAETTIVSGGATIIITVTNDTWVTTLTDTIKQKIVDGLKSSTNEKDGWNDTVPQLIDLDNVVRTSDTVVTITLPAVADYSVDDSETITAVVPHSALTIQRHVTVDSSNSLAIIATGDAVALFSGTAVDGGVTENEIVAGGETIIITLAGDTWVAAGTGPIGSTAVTQSIIDALVSTTDQAAGWNATVVGEIDTADVVRTSDTVCTITLDAVAGYSIAANETIGMTVPGAALTGAAAIAVQNTFGVTGQAPVTAAVSGTATASINEAAVVTGGKTIILTLTNDTWLAAGTGPIGSTANTQAIIDGIDSAQAEATGWDAEVKANLVPATHVVRTSDTVCTITLPAAASYDITANETITATIPAAALNISASAVVASPTITVAYIVPTTAAVTGTATASINETDVINGGKTVIVTLSNDTWVASGAVFNAIRQDIIDGLDSAQAEATGWNAKVRDVMDVTSVVRTSSTVVTITLPAAADYDTTANETITVTVPASALTTSAIAVTASPTFDVLGQAAATTAALTGTAVVGAPHAEDFFTDGGETIIITLTNDTWLAAGGSFDAQRQNIIDGVSAATDPAGGWNAEVRDAISVGSVARTSSTVCTITLPAAVTFNISSTQTITVTVPASALSIAASAVVASPTFDVTDYVEPATAALSGTITSSTIDADLVTGSKTIILTLTDDTWLAAGTGPIGTTAQTQALIDGISAAASPVNGWNNEIRDGSLTPTQVVRTSDTVCTITLAADADYAVTANETITATIPATVLTNSSVAVVASTTFTIYTATLTNATCSEHGFGIPSSVRAGIIAYNVGLKDGQVWKEVNSTYQLHETFSTPTSDADGYQMKWESNISPDPTSSTVAAGVWHPLSSGDFAVEWIQYGTGDTTIGSITVSIRRGTGDVIDTALWSAFLTNDSGDV